MIDDKGEGAAKEAFGRKVARPPLPPGTGRGCLAPIVLFLIGLVLGSCGGAGAALTLERIWKH